VQRLLDTRGGDYAAACSLDFSKPPAFYDTFALRDSEGHAAVMQSWPYFRSRASRDALKASEPVPVTSCWNGIGTIVEYLVLPFLDIAILMKSCSRHGRNSLLQNHLSTFAFPRHTRLSRKPPPRRLRMLPHPRRQPSLSVEWRLAEPQRSRRLQLARVRCGEPRRR
jgi:hypothetical protein